jgi:hypothetical protein
MTRRRGVACGVAIGWGLVATVGAYASSRTFQSFVSPDPNPAMLVWSAHAGYFWRALTAGYAGGITAFVVFLVARHRPEPMARALAPGVVVAAAILVLQAAFVP